MRKKKDNRSELQKHLDQRFEELGLGRPIVYRDPVWNEGDRAHIDNAAALHAKANRSDPFAGPRVRLHMERGLELASEIRRDATSRLQSEARHD